MLNSIDLFSGCGGMTLGFGWAGFNSVLASDIDENCEKTFATNFPQIPFLCGDLSEFTKDEFDKIISDKEIDVIIGGPPCQGFSLANKKRNKVSEDPRNKLFYEFVKTINWYNPKSFVMENVKEGMKKSNVDKIFKMHGHVIVLGIGDTALDCARSALRLGADRV
jgi:DNA (cytosine-5)-methyltransferase 1